MSRPTTQSRFLPSSFRICGLVKAWEAAAARAAQGVGGPAVPSAPRPSEGRVSILKQTFTARTPRKHADNDENPHTPRPGCSEKSNAPTPQMPGNLALAPRAIEHIPVCLVLRTPNDALLTPPDSDKDRAPAIPKTPESPTPHRDASLEPPPILMFNQEQILKAESLAPPSRTLTVTLTTADSHLPSPPPSPDAEPPVKTGAWPNPAVESFSAAPPVKVYREMSVQTDSVNILVPEKRIKLRSPSSCVPHTAKKQHIDSEAQAISDATEVKVPKENILEVKALLTSIESMECVKGLAGNILEAKALLADIASLDYVKAATPYLSAPSALTQVSAETDPTISSSIVLALPAELVLASEAEGSTVLSGGGDALDSDLTLSRVPPNSLVDDLCVTQKFSNEEQQWQPAVHEMGYPAVPCKLEHLASDNRDELLVRRRKTPDVFAEFVDKKLQFYRELVIAELKSFHLHGKKLSPVS